MSSRKSRLAPSKHHLQASNEPPVQLTPSQRLGRITKPHGNSLYTIVLPSEAELLVELPMRFRNAVWVRRGGYVLVDTDGYGEGKVGGEIVEVIIDEKAWRKTNYWCEAIVNAD
jgi:probable RNA-binding protein EIF1AD